MGLLIYLILSLPIDNVQQLRGKDRESKLEEEINKAKEEIEREVDSSLKASFPKEEVLLEEILPPLKDTPSMGGELPQWKGSKVTIRHPLYVVGIRVNNEEHYADILLEGGIGIRPYTLRLHFPKSVVAQAPLLVRGGAGLILRDTKEHGKYYKFKVWEVDDYRVELELYESVVVNDDTVEVTVGGATAELVEGHFMIYGGYWKGNVDKTSLRKGNDGDLKKKGVGIGPGFWLHLRSSLKARQSTE